MLRSISHNPILSHIPPATQMPKEANVRTGLAFSDNLHADPKKDKLLEQMEAFVDNIGEIKENMDEAGSEPEGFGAGLRYSRKLFIFQTT